MSNDIYFGEDSEEYDDASLDRLLVEASSTSTSEDVDPMVVESLGLRVVVNRQAAHQLAKVNTYHEHQDIFKLTILYIIKQDEMEALKDSSKDQRRVE